MHNHPLLINSYCQSPLKFVKMKFLSPLFPLIYAMLIFGCSSPVIKVEETAPKEKNVQVVREISQKDALENFIAGTGFEAKEDFFLAVNSYLKAYEYDPAPGIAWSIARCYYWLGKLSQALPYAREAVEKDGATRDYHYLLSDIYLSGRQPDSAALVMQNLIEKYPADYNSLYRLANIYEKSKPLSAIEVYNKILEEEPEDWNAYIRLADLYDKTGNKEKSTEVLEQFLEFNPSSVELREILVNYYIKLKKYDRALFHIDQILQLFPNKTATLQSKAEIFAEQNNYSAAADSYLKLVNDPLVNLEFKMNVGALYFEQGVKDTTLLKFSDTVFSIVEKDTVFWFTNFYKGALAVMAKDTVRAGERFGKILGDSYMYLQIWQRIGGVIYDAKRYKEAVFVLNRAQNSFPEDFLVNFFLGLSYALMGDYEASEPFLYKSTLLNPREVNAFSAYAFTLARLKKDELAINYYNKALALEPKNVELLNSLAIVYDGSGNQGKSDSLYSLSLKLDPKNALAANNFAYSLAKRGTRLDEALKFAELALAIDPNSPSYLDTYGWVQFKLGNYDTAKVYIEKALGMDGNNHELLDHFGDVLSKLGDREGAILYWKKALDLKKDNETIKRKIERGEL